MNKRIKPLISALFLAVVIVGLAHAHGKKEHEDAEKLEYDAVSKEFGSFDPALNPERTVQISMADSMRFTPAELTVNVGDAVRFVVSNEGQLQHEFVLGTAESLKEHAALMIRFPNMEHEEPYMAHVDPGKKMEIIWKFSKAGAFEFGCLLPGHFDAGMKGTILVN